MPKIVLFYRSYKNRLLNYGLAYFNFSILRSMIFMANFRRYTICYKSFKNYYDILHKSLLKKLNENFLFAEHSASPILHQMALSNIQYILIFILLLLHSRALYKNWKMMLSSMKFFLFFSLVTMKWSHLVHNIFTK